MHHEKYNRKCASIFDDDLFRPQHVRMEAMGAKLK
jgi:hypothetical protein